jgi:hypothetical protein
MANTFSEKTSAADKSVGFDYQYYYFLDTVLNLKPGQCAGLEVKDDVHTELNADLQILVQLKHTTQKNVDGSLKGLTTLDVDLWKTLSNWAQVLSDPEDGRENVSDQLLFVEKTKFLLVSNKSNSKNDFILALERNKLLKISDKELLDEVEKIQQKTDSDVIKAYIQNIIKLDVTVLFKFLRNVVFELNEDDIISRIKKSIIGKIISHNRVDGVYAALDSAISTDNYIAIKAGFPIVITFEDFHVKYGKLFSDTRSNKLMRRNLSPVLPISLQQQTFIRQLLEIGDLKSSDVDRIIRYTTCKILLEEHLNSWKAEGLLTTGDIENLHDSSNTEWYNRFTAAYRSIEDLNDASRNKNALEILDSLRRAIVEIDGQRMDINFSNGEYYLLSDLPEIGWHHEWEGKFK